MAGMLTFDSIHIGAVIQYSAAAILIERKVYGPTKSVVHIIF